jgi:hypothetical protein
VIQRIYIVAFFAIQISPGQPLSVCEVLGTLSDHKGKEVEIRGVWKMGDSGQFLASTPACERPVIRDGWKFTDGIWVVPDQGSLGVAQYYEKYNKIRKSHPKAKIYVTLSGYLETYDHFEIWTDPWGVERPRAFGSIFAASLRFLTADNFRVVPYEPGEAEEEYERYKHPQPRRTAKPSESRDKRG